MTANAWSPQVKTVTQANANGLLKFEEQIADAGQRIFSLATFAYTVGTGSIIVFKNGQLLTRNSDYVEIDATTISLSDRCEEDDKVQFLGFVGVSGTAVVDELLRSDLLAASGSGIVGTQAPWTGAASLDIKTKFSEYISVFDFLSKAQIQDIQNGTALYDVSTDVQRAIEYARKRNAQRANQVADPKSPYFASTCMLVFPPGLYRCDKSLWFGINSADANWDSSKVVENVSGYGAIIWGRTGGKPVIDLAGAFGTKWNGITIYGNGTLTPNVGVLISRSGNANGDNPSAGAHRFTDVNIHGDFSLACMYNYGSEINYLTNCYFYQNSGKTVYLITSNNARFAVTSDFCVIATSLQSTYCDFITNCIFKSSTGNTTPNGAVMWIESADYGPKIANSYIDGSGSVYMPNIYLCNALGLTSANSTSFNQGLSVVGTTFEYRSNIDLIVVEADHNVNDVFFHGNSCTINTAGGFFGIKINAGGRIKNLDCQRTSGDSAGSAFVIGGAGDTLYEAMKFTAMNKNIVGNNWAANETNFTRNGAVNTFDLAPYGIPKFAKMIAVKLIVSATGAGNLISFFTQGSGGGTPYDLIAITQVANGMVIIEGLLPVNTDKFDYNIPAACNYMRVAFRGFYY